MSVVDIVLLVVGSIFALGAVISIAALAIMALDAFARRIGL